MKNLVELSGTEKQIKWAESIRSRILVQIPDDVDDKIIKYLCTVQTKWWIDHRFSDPKDILLSAKYDIEDRNLAMGTIFHGNFEDI